MNPLGIHTEISSYQGSPYTLVLGEEIFKICAGKVAGEPFLTQDIADGFGLGLLQFPYLLFDRTR